jgi:hypothetical protein
LGKIRFCGFNINSGKNRVCTKYTCVQITQRRSL